MWDSHIMLNFPMVAQSPYYVCIYIHILHSTFNPLPSDGVIYDLRL